MKRLLRRILHSHAIGEAIENARACSNRARGHKARSIQAFDAWDEAAFNARQRRRYWMDMARALLR